MFGPLFIPTNFVGDKREKMNLWGFIGAAVLLTLMPGPDILFVITQSISRGRRSGIIFALGLCTGLIFHVAAVSLGISVLLYRSPTAFTLLKLAGAAYLVYLSIKTFRSRSMASFRFDSKGQDVRKLYRKGILMNVLNPKVILFFLAFFPQFIDPATENPAGAMLFLGLIFMLQAIVIFSSVAILADRLSIGLMKKPKAAYVMSLVEALVYLGIGLSILLM